MPPSTVAAILTRIGLGRLAALEPRPPANRYEKKRPGELVHIDVKKLGRISAKGAGHRVTGPTNRQSQHHRREGRSKRGLTGWEFVHVCVDDASRLAFAEVLADERATTAIAFLRRCLAFYRAHGVRVERVMTDGCMSSRLDGWAPFCDRARWVRVTDGAKSRRLGLSEPAARLAA
jgi:hypothetical protein